VDEKANIFKVQYLSGTKAVYAAGISVKAGVHYPGRSANLPQGYGHREVAGWIGRSQQRPVKDTSTVSEGQTWMRDRSLEFR
jgi:hypothetical protein